MSINHVLLDRLTASTSVNYMLDLDGKSYPMTQTIIDNIVTPMNRPTSRGGVYFTGETAYHMHGSIAELDIISKLSSKMLGPNTEFDELCIVANIEDTKIHIYTYLTNMIQTPTSISLNMMIVRVC